MKENLTEKILFSAIVIFIVLMTSYYYSLPIKKHTIRLIFCDKRKNIIITVEDKETPSLDHIGQYTSYRNICEVNVLKSVEK